jgi:hypothetical protein
MVIAGEVTSKFLSGTVPCVLALGLFLFVAFLSDGLFCRPVADRASPPVPMERILGGAPFQQCLLA